MEFQNFPYVFRCAGLVKTSNLLFFMRLGSPVSLSEMTQKNRDLYKNHIKKVNSVGDMAFW